MCSWERVNAISDVSIGPSTELTVAIHNPQKSLVSQFERDCFEAAYLNGNHPLPFLRPEVT